MSYADGSRFTEYTSTDHQAPLWIATSITLTYTVIFLIVRLAVKFKVLGLDDITLGAAHVRLDCCLSKEHHTESLYRYLPSRNGVSHTRPLETTLASANAVFSVETLPILQMLPMFVYFGMLHPICLLIYCALAGVRLAHSHAGHTRLHKMQCHSVPSTALLRDSEQGLENMQRAPDRRRLLDSHLSHDRQHKLQFKPRPQPRKRCALLR